MEEEEYRKAQEKVEGKTKMFFTGGHYRVIIKDSMCSSSCINPISLLLHIFCSILLFLFEG